MYFIGTTSTVMRREIRRTNYSFSYTAAVRLDSEVHRYVTMACECVDEWYDMV